MATHLPIQSSGLIAGQLILLADLRNSSRGAAFYRLSGVPVQAMSPLCKLLWFKENDAAVFGEAHKFIGIKNLYSPGYLANMPLIQPLLLLPVY